MTTIRRFIAAALTVTLVAFMASFGAGRTSAACPTLTINNPSGATLSLKLFKAGGAMMTFTVAPGANNFNVPPAGFVPTAVQTAGGANIPLDSNNCTPCYTVATTNPVGTVCIAWCYDPATCTININFTPCTPPAPCTP